MAKKRVKETKKVKKETKKVKKENDLFGTIESINTKKKINYDKKQANAFILSLWLSHDKTLMKYVDKINSVMFSLPDELVYKYFLKAIPKKKRFIKWIAKTKVDKEKKKQIEELMLEYNISEKEALLSL